MKMVKGYKDPVYAALQARYDRLTSPVNAEVEQKFDYLRSFTLAEFEEIVDSQINYALSKEGNMYGKVVLNGKDIIISISNEAKSQLVKNKIITDKALVASVKPTKSAIPVNSKPGLYVVLTAKNGNVPFWMMTYNDPTVTDLDLSKVPVPELVNIWEKEGIDAAIQAYENGNLIKGRNDNIIDLAKIIDFLEKIKSENKKVCNPDSLFYEKFGDSDIDELDSIIDEGTFDDL